MKFVHLLVPFAVLALLSALVVPALARTRAAADRKQSLNNLKQLGIALHAYHDSYGVLPPGNDDNNFSALARLLPYLEEGKLYEQIDFKKPMDDKANAAARKTVVKTFLNPDDKMKSVNNDYGPTNYLLCAGANVSLADNNGLFYQNSAVKLTAVTDGLSQTMMAGESLKGQSKFKALTVQRQYVLLKKDALKGIKEDAVAKDWEDLKNIGTDRGASWMDGRFLQSTFTGTRTLNDDKPDVSCAGLGGLSAVRSVADDAVILLGDGSVKVVSNKIKLEVWKALAGRNDGIPLPADF